MFVCVVYDRAGVVSAMSVLFVSGKYFLKKSRVFLLVYFGKMCKSDMCTDHVVKLGDTLFWLCVLQFWGRAGPIRQSDFLN